MNTRGNEQVDGGGRHAVVLGGSLAGLLAALFRPQVSFRVLLNIVRKLFDFKVQTHENANRNHGRNRQVDSSQTA